MKSVPSSEFRVTYGKIEEAVEVTALGRVIGVWTPVSVRSEGPAARVVDARVIDEVPALTTSSVAQEEAFVRPTAETTVSGATRTTTETTPVLGGTFGTSRPAPKGGTKR